MQQGGRGLRKRISWRCGLCCGLWVFAFDVRTCCNASRQWSDSLRAPFKHLRRQKLSCLRPLFLPPVSSRLPSAHAPIQKQKRLLLPLRSLHLPSSTPSSNSLKQSKATYQPPSHSVDGPASTTLLGQQRALLCGQKRMACSRYTPANAKSQRYQNHSLSTLQSGIMQTSKSSKWSPAVGKHVAYDKHNVLSCEMAGGDM